MENSNFIKNLVIELKKTEEKADAIRLLIKSYQQDNRSMTQEGFIKSLEIGKNDSEKISYLKTKDVLNIISGLDTFSTKDIRKHMPDNVKPKHVTTITSILTSLKKKGVIKLKDATKIPFVYEKVVKDQVNATNPGL